MPIYRPSRGGHAPGHIRAAFETLIEAGHAETASAHVISGQLWNCTDTMPGSLCADLDLPAGSSYAKGARVYRKIIAA